eukprot:TRINITY_DN22015_c0_g1_i1.p1 TRINITY_DN22015_c0_g1~~TRINITY_DN22015_c0_g1_i1.p1  ORF type:complete len:181 (+),score=42.04 TRINITY_DN22015_c0_g1_i1:74-616(+)
MSDAEEKEEITTPTKQSPALSCADTPGRPLPFEEELGRQLAVQIQSKKRSIENEHRYKLQSFALDLDHVGYQLVKKMCATTKSVLKYTKHEDTIRKAVKQLAAKESYHTSAEQTLSNCEKLLNIHSSIKIASIETIPVRLSVISQSIHSIVEKQKTIHAMSTMLEASIAKAQQIVLPVPR